MKVLTNLGINSDILINEFNNDYSQLKVFLDSNGLDGVEIILYGDYDLNNIDISLIKGLHLSYWPAWIDYWKGNQEVLKKDFIDKDSLKLYYCMNKPNEMIDWYKREYQCASILKAEYMVFHVSHVSLPEVFTHQHSYSDKAVLDTAAELINLSFVDQEGPALLFENLSWPGLTLLNKELTIEFLDMINYQNKGIVLDIGHLLCTNHKLRDEDEAIDYIHRVLDELGEASSLIRGVHLNRSQIGLLTGIDYSFYAQEMYNKPSLLDRLNLIHQYITATDQHLPFLNPRIKEIIDRIHPEWLVYEINTGHSLELIQDIKAQNAVLNR